MRGRFKSKTYYNVMRNVLFQRLSPLFSAIKYVEKLPHFEQNLIVNGNEERPLQSI